MKYPIVAGLFWLGLTVFAAARVSDEGRWTTFKISHNSQGEVEHQIDRTSIKTEGPYKTFWTRLWLTRQKQPLVFDVNEQLLFWTQKFAVDCMTRRFGSHYVDSNNPPEIKTRANVQNMRWESLDKVPAVGRVICGDR